MSIESHRWIEEFDGDITVCDAAGIIVAMNGHAARTFAADGGKALVGTNLLDCHPEPSRSRLREMLEKRQGNVYTIEKRGIRKLVYQSPWYRDGQYAGFVELGLVIPDPLPCFKRD